MTDVTGFGLLGHAHETAERSGVRIALAAERLPALARRGRARRRRRPHRRRPPRTASSPARTSRAPRRRELEALAYDPQTAGGLLITLPTDKRVVLEATFAAAGLPLAPRGQRSRREAE